MTTRDPLPASVLERIIALRRDLHRHPELSWDEHGTMQRISAQLHALGIPHRTGVARTGIIADLPGAQDGARVALRADTDALPVTEETGLPFASVHPGVMHACGHDGHSAMLLGAAQCLLAKPPPRPVRLIWQPAEEKGQGAKAMVEEGAMEQVGMVFGGHLDRRYPSGSLVVTDGAVNASTDTFVIDITGKQGHGARPHESVDAIVIGSALVTSLQTIVSREVDPAAPAVISVGRFDAGSAPNVIAGKAVLEGTLRAQDPAVRERLRGAIERIARAVGEVHGAQVQVTLQVGTPAVINRPVPTALARSAARDIVGDERVCTLRTANMGGEDFAYFLEEVPGAYIRYGAQIPNRETFPAHSSRFDIHEPALGVGAQWLARVAHAAGAHLQAQGR